MDLFKITRSTGIPGAVQARAHGRSIFDNDERDGDLIEGGELLLDQPAADGRSQDLFESWSQESPRLPDGANTGNSKAFVTGELKWRGWDKQIVLGRVVNYIRVNNSCYYLPCRE